jgi:glycosyltransferase involved in cell wall biosynthesis
MKVLVIASRFPWPPYTGDRLRATVWLDALAAHEVTLVGPPGDAPQRVAFHPAKRSITHLARAIATVIRKRLPLQTLTAAPYAWDDAIARAARERGPFDATVVILARAEPWARSSLAGLRILDAIDSLAKNMRERTLSASLLTRWIWRIEEKRSARAEVAAADVYDAILVVNEDEARNYGTRGIAISNGVAIRPLEPKPRRYDFGFWGRLAYFANADAVRWLLDEIWPAIRALHPAATLVIAGADASRALRRMTERRGVTLLSPVEDMPALARDVRIAILPLRYGSGESTKMLEAAEAGCAVVSTSRGVRGLAPLAAEAVIAEDAPSLAREAVTLLSDDRRRDSMAARLRNVVVQHYARTITHDRLASLLSGPTTAPLETRP